MGALFQTGMRTLATIVASLGLLAGLACDAGADSEECLICHGDRAELADMVEAGGRSVDDLFVAPEVFARTVHGAKDCTECHFDFDYPHADDAETPTCFECHEDDLEPLLQSPHASEETASCAGCHGSNHVLPASDRASPLHPLNVHVTCGTCHFDIDPRTASTREILDQRYSDDTHARGILNRGLVVSATCVSCHGGHDISGAGHPASRVGRERVEETCGVCHLGALEDHQRSIHHLLGHANGHEGATCVDCHHPHDIEVGGPGFATQAVRACSRCHEQRSSTYSQTYHGKVTSLGFGGRVATCDDCHGNHGILRASDPASMIHPDNLVQTCGACHEGAHAEFTRYEVHVDPHDGTNPILGTLYDGMVLLLWVVFGFMGLHALLWLGRGLLDREWRHARARATAQRYVRRWRPFYVGLHVTFMISFLLLGGTGLPLHFSEEAWARGIMGTVGGVAAAGWIHRFAAVIMVGCIVTYLAHITWRAIGKREKGLWTGPNTMLPRLKDVKDFVGNVKWFLGLGPKPQFDRWTYWEKFDFWAVFWGIVIIGGSGLVLWFPETATRVLPGWAINVAIILHGHEALLAVGFIFTIHIFHSNLRPDKFPMDTLFFTGRMTEGEFALERPLEYERAKSEGRLESFVARTPRWRTLLRARVIGGVVMIFGVLLVALMVYTALR